MANSKPSYNGNDSGPVDLSVAQQWANNYKSANPGQVRSHYFGRWIIDKILRQPGCTGMQIYYGLDEKGAKHLLLMGVDGQGRVMMPSTQSLAEAGGDDNSVANISYPCPDTCPEGGL